MKQRLCGREIRLSHLNPRALWACPLGQGPEGFSYLACTIRGAEEKSCCALMGTASSLPTRKRPYMCSHSGRFRGASSSREIAYPEGEMLVGSVGPLLIIPPFFVVGASSSIGPKQMIQGWTMLSWCVTHPGSVFFVCLRRDWISVLWWCDLGSLLFDFFFSGETF